VTSLASLLFDAGSDPDEALVHVDGIETTRAELVGMADELAAVLRAEGVEPGQPVAVALPNGAPLVAALFGVWRADAVYVPLNPRAPATERARILDLVQPAAVVSDRTTRGWTVKRRADPSRPGSDVALLQLTSGTTGPPRPVPLAHATVLDLLDRVLGSLKRGREAEVSRPMPNLVPVSLSLWAGIYQVLFAFRNRAAVLLMARFATVPFAELVARFGIRSVVLPPAAMTMLADDEHIASLAPLRYVRSITAPLSPLQARRFVDRFGVAVLNCYGQTELGGEVVGWTAADWREFGATKLGAVGRPHQGVEVRTTDDGELVVRLSPPTEEAARERRLSPPTEEAARETSWFRTGDLGRVDDDGFVWIDGRVSDMVNRGGLKVFPAEVEEVLRLSPAVSDAAVVGVPDARLGQVPWAFVVLVPGAALDADALARLAREHLSPYKVPIAFRSVDALPRNEVGKVLKRALVDRATSPLRRQQKG